MTEIFEFGRSAGPLDAEDRYGRTGDMKKTKYVLQMIGKAGDPDTIKCLIAAAESGMEMDCRDISTIDGGYESDAIKKLSPFGITPVLREADFITCGVYSVAPYINARGLGERIAPKGAERVALQNFWIDVACSDVAPHVKTLVYERVYKSMQDPSSEPDETAIKAAREALAAPFKALDEQLQGNKFVIGDYSWADVHWTAYVYLCDVIGEEELIDQYAYIRGWLERIKIHNNHSGQNVAAYELLPTLEDIKAGKLKDVYIEDY